MDIKAQRNRFMAFSFAGADLLLEIGSDCQVVYAVGAAGPLMGREADSLTGTDLRQVLSTADRPLIEHLVRTVKAGSRFGPMAIGLAAGGGPVYLNGCRWPGEANLYLTLARNAPTGPVSATAVRDEKTGLIGKDDFQAAASEAIESARAQGRVSHLCRLSRSRLP